MESMLMVLPDMPTDFYKCDPATHAAGDTYIEVTKLLQVICLSVSSRDDLTSIIGLFAGIH